MQQNEEIEIHYLYDESVVEASASARPQYLVFAEKIISRETNLIAKLLCFQCAAGQSVEKDQKREQWVHRIVGANNYELVEICRANVVLKLTHQRPPPHLAQLQADSVIE